MRARIGQAVDTIVAAGGIMGGIALWALTLIVAYDVVLRYLGHPTIWALEISTYLLIAVGIAGTGETLKRGAHFTVDILPELLRPRPRRRLEAVLSLATVVFAVYFAWGVWLLLETTLMLGIRSPTVLKVPLVWPQSLLLVGAVTLALAGLQRLVGLLRISERSRP